MKQGRDETSQGAPARGKALAMAVDPAEAAGFASAENEQEGEGERASVVAFARDGEARARSELSDSAIDAERMRAMRMWYVGRFKLTSAFLGVSQLANILGMAPSTIYSLIRAGRFFLPHRMMNASPRVWIDDLVAWHLSGEGPAAALGREPSKPREAPANPDAEGEGKGGRALTRAEVNAAVSKAADDALRAAGIDPATRRRRKAR